MRLLIAALALMASACSPMQGPASDPQFAGGDLTETAAQTACEQRGGTMQRVGRLQTLQCVVSYADAGKRCTDGDQCGGDCLLPETGSVQAGAAAAGQCAATSNRFGCATRVEDGKADATLCID